MRNGFVLVLGSGPNAVMAREWPRALFESLVVINNAWRVREDWTHLIHPEDFPPERRPETLRPTQTVVTAQDYVPAQNSFGGFVYAGRTMALTAGYWALFALRPKVLAFMGCDMVYPASGPTHFYGTGSPDPLRSDVTLQDLPAKSARLALVAAERGCACVNLSASPSQLVFPRHTLETLNSCAYHAPLAACLLDRARQAERDLGYYVPSGRYWEAQESFDAKALAHIDQLWREAHRTFSVNEQGHGDGLRATG